MNLNRRELLKTAIAAGIRAYVTIPAITTMKVCSAVVKKLSIREHARKALGLWVVEQIEHDVIEACCGLQPPRLFFKENEA